MNKILMLFLLSSCALILPDRGPAWVQGIRSGEERTMLTNGQRLLYRQIAPTCSRAVRRTQNLIYREYSVAPVLEVQWSGPEDCAVTMSIPANSPRIPAFVPPPVGMDMWKFQKLINSRIYISFDHENVCWNHFGQAGYTHHGTHVICWDNLRIVGYYQEE